jgi:hypothetical protein
MDHYTSDCPSEPVAKASGGSTKAVDGALLLISGGEDSGEDD